MLGMAHGLPRADRCCTPQARGSLPLTASHGSFLLHNHHIKARQAALPKIAVQGRLRSSSATATSARRELTQLQYRGVPAARLVTNLACPGRQLLTTRAMGEEGSGDSARSTAGGGAVKFVDSPIRDTREALLCHVSQTETLSMF
jgi:hypothetical protein